MRAFAITSADVAKCPFLVMSVQHYRDDGSCYHFTPEGSGPISPEGQRALAMHRQVLRMKRRVTEAERKLRDAEAALPYTQLFTYRYLAAEIVREELGL